MKITSYQAAFSAGALDRRLLQRKDTRAYYLGCRTLRNFIVLPQGPAKVRPGLRMFGSATGGDHVALASFVFSTTERYLIAFTDKAATVWDADSGVVEATLALPYADTELKDVRWQQIADVLVVVHPAHRIREIRRGALGWSVENWTWTGEHEYEQPYHKYQPDAVTLDPDGTSGSIKVDASEAIFDATWVGRLLRFKDGYFRITGYTSPTRVSADVLKSPADKKEDRDWGEQAFSDVHGWPRTVRLHGGRLWWGGALNAPNQLWSSKSYAFRTVMEGDADDESVTVQVTNGTFDPILHMESGRRGLEVYTVGGEFLIPAAEGSPITPSTLEVRAQTPYGAGDARPVNVDGSTVFVQRDGGSLRQFSYDFTAEAMVSDSLVIRIPELIKEPRGLAVLNDAFNLKVDLLLVVNGDGTGAMFSFNRPQELAAWSEITIEGSMLAAQAVGPHLFVATRRAGFDGFLIERFDPAARLDASRLHEDAAGTVLVPGLSWLSGQQVHVYGDDVWNGRSTVTAGGNLTLDTAARAIEAGYDFDVELTPMPLESAEQPLSMRRKRLVRVGVHVQDTAGLTINGRAMPSLELDGALGQPQPLKSGLFTARLSGWGHDPQVTVRRTGPFPMTLVALTIDAAVS